MRGKHSLTVHVGLHLVDASLMLKGAVNYQWQEHTLVIKAWNDDWSLVLWARPLLVLNTTDHKKLHQTK